MSIEVAPTEASLTEDARKRYENHLNELINHARLNGIVLEIESVPLEPFAMGYYALVGRARLANELYRSNT